MKSLRFLILFLLLVPALAPAGMHPVYVSVTNIDFNEREKSLEITCRVFTNDYERVLRKSYKGKVDLLGNSNKASMDSLIQAYMNSHLSLTVNGKMVPLQYIGFEQDEDAILNYLEVTGIENITEIKVNNTVLYDLWEKQQSLIHVTVKGSRKSTRLINPTGTAVFYF